MPGLQVPLLLSFIARTLCSPDNPTQHSSSPSSTRHIYFFPCISLLLARVVKATLRQKRITGVCVAIFRIWPVCFWPSVLQCQIVFLCLCDLAVQPWGFCLDCEIYFWSGISRTSLGPVHNFNLFFYVFHSSGGSLRDYKPRALTERQMVGQWSLVFLFLEFCNTKRGSGMILNEYFSSHMIIHRYLKVNMWLSLL